MRSNFIISIFCIAPFGAFTQPVVTNNPVAAPLVLSGNFGEVRGSHFHAGIDIKVDGMTAVTSVWDGNVSRIKVERGGYGKAIYITHPNGLTTVYAHLARLTDELDNWLKERQYEAQSFEVDVKPHQQKNLSIKAGQLIGYSGNTGSSKGPHLHFEVRNAQEEPIDPISCGIKLEDPRPPVLSSITVYAHGTGSEVDGQLGKKRFPIVANADGSYALAAKEIQVAGVVSLGIGNHDLLNGAENLCGNRSLRVEVDGATVFEQTIDKLSFDWKRGALATLDLEAATETIQRTYRAPGNNLPIYPKLDNNGMIRVVAGKTYQVKVTVTDRSGNASTVSFNLIGKAPSSKAEKVASVSTFYHNANNSYKGTLFQISAPEKCLFDSLLVTVKDLGPCPKGVGNKLKICNNAVPLRIEAMIGLPIPANEKPLGLGLYRFEADGKTHFCGKEVNGNMVVGGSGQLGEFALLRDVVAPTMTPINVKNGDNVGDGDTLKFKVTDNLSGIQEYQSYGQGNFILMEFDEKNDLLFHVVDDRTKSGDFILTTKLLDGMGNTGVFEFNFRR